jgi:hypothetical protein
LFSYESFLPEIGDLIIIHFSQTSCQCGLVAYRIFAIRQVLIQKVYRLVDANHVKAIKLTFRSLKNMILAFQDESVSPSQF